MTWTEAATGAPGASMKLDTKEDPAETVLSSDSLRHSRTLTSVSRICPDLSLSH